MILRIAASAWRSPFTALFGVLCGFLLALVLPGALDLGGEQYDGLRPVIRDWKVTAYAVEDGDLIISGTMVKVRDCLLVPPAIARDSNGVPYKLLSPLWAAKDASDAPQPWGPWTIVKGANRRLTFVMAYMCSGGRPSIVTVGSYGPIL